MPNHHALGNQPPPDLKALVWTLGKVACILFAALLVTALALVAAMFVVAGVTMATTAVVAKIANVLMPTVMSVKEHAVFDACLYSEPVAHVMRAFSLALDACRQFTLAVGYIAQAALFVVFRRTLWPCDPMAFEQQFCATFGCAT